MPGNLQKSQPRRSILTGLRIPDRRTPLEDLIAGGRLPAQRPAKLPPDILAGIGNIPGLNLDFLSLISARGFGSNKALTLVTTGSPMEPITIVSPNFKEHQTKFNVVYFLFVWYLCRQICTIQ